MSEPGPGPSPPAGDATTVEFALTEQEYVDANMRLSGERLRRNVPVGGGIAATWALAAGSGTLPPKFLVWMLPLTYAMNAALAYPMARSRRRRAFHSSAKPAVARVTLSADGYLAESGGSDLFIRWPSFSHYEETATAWLLYHGPVNALILPKSALADAQRREVPELLKEWIGRTSPTARGRFPVEPPPA